MTPYTKLMMIHNAKRERGGAYRGTMEYRGEAEFAGGYGGEPEGRFRDSRGRERYNDGRYAPRGGGYDDMEPEDRMPPIYDGRNTGYRYDGGGNRMIGFSGGSEIQSNYRMDATHRAGDEMEHRSGHKMAGHASSDVQPLDRETARGWVKRMRHADGSVGEHWTMDQTNQVMKQRGIDCEPEAFYAIMNAMWSDYSKVADKFGVNNVDFWAELTKAFLMDKDAMPDKAALYYECIVKK